MPSCSSFPHNFISFHTATAFPPLFYAYAKSALIPISPSAKAILVLNSAQRKEGMCSAELCAGKAKDNPAALLQHHQAHGIQQEYAWNRYVCFSPSQWSKSGLFNRKKNPHKAVLWKKAGSLQFKCICNSGSCT